jgi:uncharacterized membrane protein YecN with MAPEG domain
MPVTITLFYAGLNGLIAVGLAFLVVRQRMSTKTLFGTGGNPALERAIRAHSNFIEYVPLILLLMLLLELGGATSLRLHIMGAALTIGRLLHAWGLSRSSGRSFGRGAGIALTWIVLVSAALSAVIMGANALWH